MPKYLIEDAQWMQSSSYTRNSMFPSEKQGIPHSSSSTLIHAPFLERPCKEFSTIKVIWWQGTWTVRPFGDTPPIDLITKNKLAFRISFQYQESESETLALLSTPWSGRSTLVQICWRSHPCNLQFPSYFWKGPLLCCGGHIDQKLLPYILWHGMMQT